ncbi:MAG: hypothetical protein JSV91_08330 [Phycisphaerales bacterium]|nr:MAG: hypothetical protein JSV91_08330 [Phycisphaerales bacterium]
MIPLATITDISQAMRELPWSDLSPVLGLELIGIGLWLAGRRFLRMGLVIAGVLVGGTAGWIIAELLAFPVSPWIFVIIGAVGFGCFAALMFRFAVAGTLALVLALAAPTAVWTVGEWQGVTDTSPTDLRTTGPADSAEELEPPDSSDSADPAEAEDTDEGPPAAGLVGDITIEQAQKQIVKLRGYTEWAIKKAESIWAQTPANLRPEMVGAAIVGLLAGFLIGTIAPKLSAAVVTSFGGAMLMLITLRVIAERLGIHEGWWMPAKATPWLVMWLITSLIGTAIQWTLRPKRADNPA